MSKLIKIAVILPSPRLRSPQNSSRRLAPQGDSFVGIVRLAGGAHQERGPLPELKIENLF